MSKMSISHYQLFHENKSLYFIHKLHHKLVKPIPSNGNAVSILEYNSAYVAPFLIGALIFKPNGISFQLAIAIISILNSFVHCIPLKNIRLFPLFVVPNDHLIHHEKLTTKYASPFFNVDTIDKFINNHFNITELQRNQKYRNTVGL